MTSKERVIKALNHEEPDRVPFMYRDVPEVRKRLKADLELSTDDEQKILPFGSPEKVRDEVLRIIDIMAPGGGYFLGPTHNFQDDCQTENILAMYLAANNGKSVI